MDFSDILYVGPGELYGHAHHEEEMAQRRICFLRMFGMRPDVLLRIYDDAMAWKIYSQNLLFSKRGQLG
jgi:hypothetical protein